MKDLNRKVTSPGRSVECGLEYEIDVSERFYNVKCKAVEQRCSLGNGERDT